jgi:hypothetical protein
MTWNELEQQRRVAREATSKQELELLRALAQRNLNDASHANLSADGKFSMVYDAARTLASIPIRAHGYRTRQSGDAHYNTFVALEVAMGSSVATIDPESIFYSDRLQAGRVRGKADQHKPLPLAVCFPSAFVRIRVHSWFSRTADSHDTSRTHAFNSILAQ